MQDSKQDFALALVLFGIGLGALLYIQFGPGQALQSSQDAQITFRSFPSAIAMMLMALSALFALSSGMAIRSLREPERPVQTAPSAAPPKYLRLRILALLGLLIAFALAIGTLPLVVLASVFLFVAFMIFGQTNLLRVTVVAIIGGALFHGLFVLILHLPLG